ncbi:MAG: hypothetical protein Q8Q30_03505 [Candidatus Woesebacteria bacterium]|nr:hypothetical protein [Candidatus Woesebacteria bacterium]
MRRSEKKIKKQKTKSKIVLIILLFVTLTISFLLFSIFKVSILDKFIYVNKTSNSLTEVVVVDPKKDRTTKYEIPLGTVLRSSRGFGEYKIESLWILAKKENFEGKLVSESVTSNYLVPFYLWKDGVKTNLNIFQRMKVFFNRYNNNNIDKKFTSFDLPSSILIDFLDNDIQEAGLSVELNDLTGDQDVVKYVSSILGNLGTKISTYTKGYEEDLDCEIYGTNAKAVKIISNIFDCKINGTEVIRSDIRIKLGAKFADRF